MKISKLKKRNLESATFKHTVPDQGLGHGQGQHPGGRRVPEGCCSSMLQHDGGHGARLDGVSKRRAWRDGGANVLV